MKYLCTFIIAVGLIALAYTLGSRVRLFDFGTEDDTHTNTDATKAQVLLAGSKEKFDFLSVQRSSTCGLQASSVETYTDAMHIQGSCCSPMDLHRYQEQVEGLKAFSGISQIPGDPYDISAALAKELFKYQREIELDSEQQTTYDEAMELSDEGGPCCCKCWRWQAFEGQAKYLISNYDWNSQQIADLWDLQDGCGGVGHTHG